VFQYHPHWIFPRVRQWRRALGLIRDEARYFELLTILAASPHVEEERGRMLIRAFRLLGALEETLDTEQAAPHGLIYWHDPVHSLLRNAVANRSSISAQFRSRKENRRSAPAVGG